MKQILILLASTLFLFGCQRSHSGDVEITGHLLFQCGSTDPLGGVDVTFSINGSDFITTKTDAFGYFKLQGSYSYQEDQFGSTLEKSITMVNNGQNGSGFSSVYLACMVPDKVDLDTVYLENSTMFKITVAPPNTGYGSFGDSLFIGFVKPLYLRIDNNDNVLWKAIALPINDTLQLEPEVSIAPSHLGYASGNCMGQRVSIFYGKSKSYSERTYVEWIPGQPNHACGRVYDVTIDLSK